MIRASSSLVAGGGAGTAARGRDRPRARHPAGGRAAGAGRHIGARHPAGRPPPRRVAFGPRTGRRTSSPSSSGGCSPSWSPRRREILESEQIPEERRRIERSVDVRYYGQTPYMNLALDETPDSRDRDRASSPSVTRTSTSASSATGLTTTSRRSRSSTRGSPRLVSPSRPTSRSSRRSNGAVSEQQIARGLLRRGRGLHRHADL